MLASDEPNKTPNGNDIEIIKTGSPVHFEGGDIKIGSVEAGGSIVVENGDLIVGLNEGKIIFVGNTVNGVDLGANNRAEVSINRGFLQSTVDTVVKNNEGTIRLVPNNKSLFRCISDIPQSGEQVFITVQSGLDNVKAAAKDIQQQVGTIVGGILYAPTWEEGLKNGIMINFTNAKKDPQDRNCIYAHIVDGKIQIVSNHMNIEGDHSVWHTPERGDTITSIGGKLNVSVQHPHDNMVDLTCGTQKVRLVYGSDDVSNIVAVLIDRLDKTGQPLFDPETGTVRILNQ